MIRPILCYGSEIWSAFDGNKKIFQNIDGIPKFLDSLDIENVHVKDICGYSLCAPFPRLQTGKVVWVLSFDP